METDFYGNQIRTDSEPRPNTGTACELRNTCCRNRFCRLKNARTLLRDADYNKGINCPNVVTSNEADFPRINNRLRSEYEPRKDYIRTFIDGSRTGLRCLHLWLGLHLYWVDQTSNKITCIQTNVGKYTECAFVPGDKRYLVTLAAGRKQIVFVKSVSTLIECNPEIQLPYEADSIISVPILTFEHKVLAIIELYTKDGLIISEERKTKSLQFIEEFSKWFSIWLAQRVKFNEEAVLAHFHETLREYMLQYVNDTLPYDKFISKFLIKSKKQIKAEKCYFYDYDSVTKLSDFYEEVDHQFVKTGGKVKFYQIDSFCYRVREEKQPIETEIGDDCKQLDKEIKQDLKNPIRQICFYPLMFGEIFLGILIFGSTGNDENRSIFEFAESKNFRTIILKVLGNALAYKSILQQTERQAAHTDILRETLMNLLKARLRTQFFINENQYVTKQIYRSSWEPTDFDDPHQLTYIYKMFQASYPFNWNRLKAFLKCVQIAHNDYPYHNIKTTFYICRTVYWIIDKLSSKLKPYERAALMISAVLYYCCHNMLDNHLMMKIKHPLLIIHKNHMKESSRLWMLKLLLDQTKLLVGNQESELITSITNTLLLRAVKFESEDFREKISSMIDTGAFNHDNSTHRLYALLLILRIGVHARHMQPFHLAKKLRDNYYMELIQLGELERKHGFVTENRKNQEIHLKIPQFEIDFIKNSVIPTLKILTRLFPQTSSRMKMPSDILKAHEILVSAGDKRLWDPEKCIGIGRNKLN